MAFVVYHWNFGRIFWGCFLSFFFANKKPRNDIFNYGTLPWKACTSDWQLLLGSKKTLCRERSWTSWAPVGPLNVPFTTRSISAFRCRIWWRDGGDGGGWVDIHPQLLDLGSIFLHSTESEGRCHCDTWMPFMPFVTLLVNSGSIEEFIKMQSCVCLNAQDSSIIYIHLLYILSQFVTHTTYRNLIKHIVCTI